MFKNLIAALAFTLVVSNVYAADEKPATPAKKVEKQAAKEAEKAAAAEVEPTADQLLEISPDDIVLGDKNAPVTIIEYASMSCSHCAAFHNSTFSDLKEKYIDTGKVKFVFRDFPLDEPGLRGAMMARCAGREGADKYVKFTKVIFNTQSNWVSKKNYLEVLANLGKLGGMKGEDFDACMADKKLEDSVVKSKYLGSKQLEIRSTPTFFINKEMHKGAKDLAYFSGVIDGLLAKDTKNTSENKPKAETIHK